MKILLADENPEDLEKAGDRLRALGHSLATAGNATLALARFDEERPDVVIASTRLPDADGLHLTRLLQDRVAPNWQPVILLASVRDDELESRALQLGAEAMMVRPLIGPLLAARLLGIERVLDVQRKAEERAGSLARYRAIEDDERRIARHLIERLVSASKLDDPALRHWILPATGFSGDVIASARTPGNVLHVMLADGTGHGLAASINVLPIASPFYSMTEKGFSVDSIARELNDKVRHFLPRDRFVAATLAAIDFRERSIQVWNGGNPGPLLFDADGGIRHRFSAWHLPLGVGDPHDFDAALETVRFPPDAQLLLFSDGLVETPGFDSIGTDREGLPAAFKAALSGRRFEAILDLVRRQLAGSPAQDDISIALVDCRHDVAPVRERRAGDVGDAESGGWRFSLRLGPAELRRLDIVPLLLGLVKQFEEDHAFLGELFVVLSELFNNSLDHGLLRLDSGLKRGPDGFDAFLAQRSQRLADLREGEIVMTVERTGGVNGTSLRVTCLDSGEGFDTNGIANRAASQEAPFGRGLELVARLCSDIEFNRAGNQVTGLLPLFRTSGTANWTPVSV